MLSEEIFASHWAKGQAFTLKRAIAMHCPHQKCQRLPFPQAKISQPVLATPAYPAGLTAREARCCGLWRKGYLILEIADKLVISHRTVNAHVTSIFSKLGVTTRAAATRFAVDHNLG